MELPNKFQFRIMKYTGFTHSAKINEWGDYEVKWARGYAQHINNVPSVIVEETWFKEYLDDGRWQIVQDKPKQKEQEVGKLPDVFYFEHSQFPGDVHKAEKRASTFLITWSCGSAESHVGDQVNEFVNKYRWWRILDKKPLTPEQERTIKSYREQIAALDSSIKINEQTIHHHQLLIANYRNRQDDLHEKIAEISGEESPKVAKAKAMKAELEKLK